MLGKYLNKALELAENVGYRTIFTMKSLLSNEERIEIGTNINELGRLFKKAIDEEKAKGVVYVGKTPQNECLYQRHK